MESNHFLHRMRFPIHREFRCVHSMKTIIPFIFLFLVQSALCADVDLLQHEKGIWSIAGTAEKNMWIVIHNLKEAKETGIYHIEVLARGVNEPAWKVEHVVEHMAITQSALAASVLKPLNKGAVYPETFDNAYHDWQKQNSGKGGFICTSHLSECMRTLHTPPLHSDRNSDAHRYRR